MADILNVEVSNLTVPILGVEISPFVNFASEDFVARSISGHNISSEAHQDIRDSINNLSTNLSGYAQLSGASFYGDIYALNLSGINTGDQDLSNLSTYSFVTSSISSHNISNESHNDMRIIINNLNDSLSGYVIKITTAELSSFIIDPETEGIYDIITKHNNLIYKMLGE